MAALVFETFFIIAMVALAIGIGAMCLEMVIRLIGRGLGSELSPQPNIARGTNRQAMFR